MVNMYGFETYYSPMEHLGLMLGKDMTGCLERCRIFSPSMVEAAKAAPKATSYSRLVITPLIGVNKNPVKPKYFGPFLGVVTLI